MNVYVVDTNFFISAHRSYYPFDVVPGFWNKIKQLAIDGIIVSIDKVKDEIFHNDDVLKVWCEQNLPEYFFKSIDEVLPAYSEIVNWVNSRNNHYTQAAIIEFLNVDEADAFLVAYALTDIENRIIVTHEVTDIILQLVKNEISLWLNVFVLA